MYERLYPGQPLIQERYKHDPWKLLVVCILMNRTHIRQVEPMVEEFFERYPSPDSIAKARVMDEEDILQRLRPLGSKNRRFDVLKRLSIQWCTMIGRQQVERTQGTRAELIKTVSNLPGIGEYALDSYKMFVLNDLSVEPTDLKLIDRRSELIGGSYGYRKRWA